MGRRAKERSEVDRAESGGDGQPGVSDSSPQSPASKLRGIAARILKSATTADIPRSSIAFASYNPRQMSPDGFRRLRASVRRFGLVEDPVVNVRSQSKGWPDGSQKTVVGGHQRIRAVDAELKYPASGDYSLTVKLIDVDEMTERALNVALNNPELQAQFDAELLQGVVEWLHERGGADAIDGTGYTTTELSLFFGDDFAAKVGMFAEQGEQEGGYVDELRAMKDARRRADGAAAGGESSASSTESEESEPADLETPPSESSISSTSSEDSEPTPVTAADVKADLARKREAFKSKWNRDSGDHALILVFDGSEDLAAFVDRYGLPLNKYIDAQQFCELAGVEWPGGGGGEPDGPDAGGDGGTDDVAGDLFT